MKRLAPLLLVLAACGSSKAADLAVTPSAPASSDAASDVASSSPGVDQPSGGGSDGTPGATTPVPPGTVVSTVAPSTSASLPNIPVECPAAKLALSIKVVSSGSNASFSVALVSHAAKTCSVTEGAITPSIAVSNDSGPVWAAGCDHGVSGHAGPGACPEYAKIQELKPGVAQTFTQDWDGTADALDTGQVLPAGPGAYTVSASVGGVTAKAAFSLS